MADRQVGVRAEPTLCGRRSRGEARTRREECKRLGVEQWGHLASGKPPPKERSSQVRWIAALLIETDCEGDSRLLVVVVDVGDETVVRC